MTYEIKKQRHPEVGTYYMFCVNGSEIIASSNKARFFERMIVYLLNNL